MNFCGHLRVFENVFAESPWEPKTEKGASATFTPSASLILGWLLLASAI